LGKLRWPEFLESCLLIVDHTSSTARIYFTFAYPRVQKSRRYSWYWLGSSESLLTGRSIRFRDQRPPAWFARESREHTISKIGQKFKSLKKRRLRQTWD